MSFFLNYHKEIQCLQQTLWKYQNAECEEKNAQSSYEEPSGLKFMMSPLEADTHSEPPPPLRQQWRCEDDDAWPIRADWAS